MKFVITPKELVDSATVQKHTTRTLNSLKALSKSEREAVLLAAMLANCERDGHHLKEIERLTKWIVKVWKKNFPGQVGAN